MVVRFDLEDGGQTVADVDCPCVFPWPLNHTPAGGGQFFEVNARALVAAVFGPHHRKDAELGDGGLTPEHFENALVFIARQAMPLEKLAGNNHRVATTVPCVTYLTTDSRTTRPSELPRESSQARSGWGIRPTTLRPSLHKPAML